MAEAPCCPRCGYDLSGQIAAAQQADPTSFPLRGRCSECGLEFWWVDAFRPDRHRVRGFVEHSRLSVTPLTAWRTWLWTLWPAWFWGKVQLEHKPRVWRMVLWLVLVLLVPYAAGGLPGMIMGWPWTVAGWRAVSSVLGVLLSPWGEYIWQNWRDGTDPVMRYLSGYPAFVPAGVVLSLLFPLVLLCLPTTLGRLKVTHGHLLRASVYQWAWLVPVLIFKAAKIAAYNVAWHKMASAWSPPLGMVVSGRPYTGTNWADFWMEIGHQIGRAAHGYWGIWLVAIVVWWCLWWRAVLVRGWRLERARPIWIAAAVPSLLGALIVLVLHRDVLRAFL